MNGGFQFFDIILFAFIAAFLVMRLRSVLGRRDGSEGSRRYTDPFSQSKDDDNVIQLPERGKTVSDPRGDEEAEHLPPADEEGAQPSASSGLAQIRIADPSFDESHFIEGARGAFEMILDAYARGDHEALEPLLSKDVYAGFLGAIEERNAEGNSLDTTLVGFRAVELTEAWMDGRVAHVTVRFVSEQVNVTRDSEGRIIDGDPNRVEEVTDLWTFARDTRSRDPNWHLVATLSPEE